MSLDDFRLYLPKFLSAESDKELFDNLRSFPHNIDQRLYTRTLADTDIVYQGDGVNDMLVVNLPDSNVKPVPSIILSNTCDISLDNKRNFPSQVVYAPIFNLERYRQAIENNSTKSQQQIDSHIQSIRKQEITQVFFLPGIEGKLDDSLVFLDRVCNLPNSKFSRENLDDRRLFTLSNYGIYMFVFKLSIHFSRIQDGVDRKTE